MCREGEPFNSIGFALCFVCVYVYVCVCSCDRERDLHTPSPHIHISTMDRLQHCIGAEEVRGKLIDENLELEEDKQDHH